MATAGAIAGLYARTDAARGVWKAPAGTEATLRGPTSLQVALTDLENGTINPLGLNANRALPVYGFVVWGARTLDGADVMASQWKYVPVRRTALYIEERCDSETTTQNDIDQGIVNILVGFAPLKPAEFVVIQITQLAGQVES
jgi:phage tail sheath protein FI